ncbi:MAG: isochorismatase family protein [Synergistaceae bacterium]|nr:isochorismatase family protein [Synergistaceae bacterium]
MTKDILVVDCQYDFIDGTLACAHAEEAVKNIIRYINAHPDARVFYSADWHGPKHCSYIPNGGTWPVHCQAGTHGAELHSAFTTDIKNPEQRPSESNIYRKGTYDAIEEYSAFRARNIEGDDLSQVLGQDVLICGIATEFCVKETVLEFVASWRNIDVSASMLGWVDGEGHKKTIAELSALGADADKIKAIILGEHFGDWAIGSCCHDAMKKLFDENSLINSIIDSAWGNRFSGDPAKLMTAAISAAPEREQEIRDAFGRIGKHPAVPSNIPTLKESGYRVVLMSNYSIDTDAVEFVKPQAPENIAGIVPQESLFAADEDTCRAAEAAGFRTLPSPDINHLRKALSRMLVKVDVHD